MVVGDIAGFVAAGVALLISPGPATLSMAAAAAAYGPRVAWSYYFGLLGGLVFVVTCVTAGVITAIATIPYAAEGLTIFAVAYIAYLAFRIATAPPVGEARPGTRTPGFFSAAILNITNVKAYAAFTALFASFDLVPGDPFLSGALKCALAFTIVATGNMVWLLTGTALQRFFRDPKTSRIINISFAILLIGSVAMTLVI
jgi:threonine/homoserine/homoserine lactone efflux protein